MPFIGWQLISEDVTYKSSINVNVFTCLEYIFCLTYYSCIYLSPPWTWPLYEESSDRQALYLYLWGLLILGVPGWTCLHIRGSSQIPLSYIHLPRIHLPLAVLMNFFTFNIFPIISIIVFFKTWNSTVSSTYAISSHCVIFILISVILCVFFFFFFW